MRLTFLPRPSPTCRKRSRPAADIDGEHSCVQKKKRRLRLFLITSRLSPQFSHPASNIVDRGSSKIAVWAKQKALGRNLLPKAAILNGIRRRNLVMRDPHGLDGRVSIVQEKEEAHLELARLEFTHGSVDTYTHPVLLQEPSVPPSAAIRTGNRFVVSGSPASSPSSSRSSSPTSHGSPTSGPDETTSFRSPNEAWVPTTTPTRGYSSRKDYHPLPPSPLGISNYDAFDVEEEVDPYAHLDDEDELLPSPFDDEDDETVPFSPSAATNAPTTVHTSTVHAASMYPDCSMLGYDLVDNEADAAWPNIFTASRSVPKRTDSFATSPNFRPSIPKKSVSPDMAATTTPASPNFMASTPVLPSLVSSTPKSPSLTPVAISPNFVPVMAPASVSPEFPALAAGISTSPNFSPALMSANPSWVKKVSSIDE
ncbi:hypothetical protein yc1106_09368 [Curvularia clavata]|uniref:Uncharacterized protein n=1 Tax=Curvularia clavata TaxID=95742 RepID=A0A9Q8ZG83_CURCL|nr:hypothetical protein yc1106_09368 [Curvularia clavata]